MADRGHETNKEVSEEDLRKLASIIGSIKYGSVTAIIQEGKIIQIEKSEKVRLK